MECDVLVFGSINCDRVMHVADFSRPGETIRCLSSAESLGGKGANQAMAAARAGARVAMFGAVGADDAGRGAIETLGACIDISGISTFTDCPTGTAAIQIAQSGENTIVIDGGANSNFHSAYLPNDIPAGCICVAQLEMPIEAISAFLRSAKAAGATTLLNAAPADAIARPLLGHCDILIVNQTELAMFADAAETPADADAAAAMARHILAHEGQIIIVTLGAAGAVAIGHATRVDVCGRPADVVDTTGAGDCFCGVLAASLAARMDLHRSIERANAAAAIQVGRPGAAKAMPNVEEIERGLFA